MDSSLPLFYHPGKISSGETVQLSLETARHATAVLRMGSGDSLRLTNGKGLEAEAVLSSVSKKAVSAAIGAVQEHPAPERMLHLAVALTKNTARNEWLLEKAAELGVTRITPLITARGNRERIRRDRADGILVSAMMQSGQFYLCLLDEAMPLQDVLRKPSGAVYIAHCLADRSRIPIAQVSAAGRSNLVLIGPEGDFSPEEISLAEAAGAQSISLGETRLRTETAAMAACAYFHLQK